LNAIPNITETKDKENLDYTEETDDTEKTDDTGKNLKRKWTRKTSASSSSYKQDDASADKADPPAKQVKRKKLIDDVGVIPVPPCHSSSPVSTMLKSKKECIPNGWSAASKSCRKPKMTCSLDKARNRGPKSNAITGDAEKHQSITSFLSKKSTAKLDERSSIEDVEDVVDHPQISNTMTVNLSSATGSI